MRLASCIGLTVIVATIAAFAGCASFDATDDGTNNGDAGADAETDGADGSTPGVVIARRDLKVVLELPSKMELDPSKHPELSKVVVSITDSYAGSRNANKEGGKADLGPYDFPQFESTSFVDAVVELHHGDGRLIGYGEARRVDVGASSTITVVVRKRLLYAIRGDGIALGDARLLEFRDLAPNALAEPSFQDPADPIAPLPSASAIVLTPDARLLAVAFADGGGGKISVLDTSSHMSVRNIVIPFPPSRMVAIGDGREVLALPGKFASTAQLARVNLDTGDVKSAESGLQGGALYVESAATSFDGKKVVAAANYKKSPVDATTTPYLIEYDVTAGKANAPVMVTDVTAVTAVRPRADGGEIFALGWTGTDPSNASGKVLTFDGARGTQTLVADLLTYSLPTTLVVHPKGHRAYVSTALQYTGNGPVGGTFFAFDETWSGVGTFASSGSVLAYQVLSALRLPYAPFRVLAAMSDDGNTNNGSIVELLDDNSDPQPLLPKVDLGSSLQAIASPFAQPL